MRTSGRLFRHSCYIHYGTRATTPRAWSLFPTTCSGVRGNSSTQSTSPLTDSSSSTSPTAFACSAARKIDESATHRLTGTYTTEHSATCPSPRPIWPFHQDRWICLWIPLRWNEDGGREGNQAGLTSTVTTSPSEQPVRSSHLFSLPSFSPPRFLSVFFLPSFMASLSPSSVRPFPPPTHVTHCDDRGCAIDSPSPSDPPLSGRLEPNKVSGAGEVHRRHRLSPLQSG